MRLFTRSTALAVILMLSQFLLVGSGYACLGGEHARADMSAQGTAVGMSLREAPDEHAGCGDGSRPAQCMLSGVSCSALGACGVATMTGETLSNDGIVGVTEDLAVAPSGHALTRSIPPELPPPRA